MKYDFAEMWGKESHAIMDPVYSVMVHDISFKNMLKLTKVLLNKWR